MYNIMYLHTEHGSTAREAIGRASRHLTRGTGQPAFTYVVRTTVHMSISTLHTSQRKVWWVKVRKVWWVKVLAYFRKLAHSARCNDIIDRTTPPPM